MASKSLIFSQKKGLITIMLMVYFASVVMSGVGAGGQVRGEEGREVAVVEKEAARGQEVGGDVWVKQIGEEGVIVESGGGGGLIIPENGGVTGEPVDTKDEAEDRARSFLEKQNDLVDFPKEVPLVQLEGSGELFSFIEQARESGLRLVTTGVTNRGDRYIIRLGAELNGIRILDQELSVSIEKDSGKVVAVKGRLGKYELDPGQSNPQTLEQCKSDLITYWRSQQYGWFDTPEKAFVSATPVYYVVEDESGGNDPAATGDSHLIRLGYVFEAQLSYPFGVWRYLRDAQTSETIREENTTLLATIREPLEADASRPDAGSLLTGSGATVTIIPAQAESGPLVAGSEQEGGETSNLFEINPVSSETSNSPLTTSDFELVSDLSSGLAQTFFSGLIVSDTDLSRTLSVPLGWVRVLIAGESEARYADETGSVNVLPERVERVDLASQRIDIVDDQIHAIPVLSRSSVPGTGSGSIQITSSGSVLNQVTGGSFPLLDTNSYYYANFSLNELQRISQVDMPEHITIHTNSSLARETNNGCKAFTIPGLHTIHLGSGGCEGVGNLALSPDVIIHEIAHVVVENLKPFSYRTPEVSAMREGISDYLAGALNNDPVIGQSVFSKPNDISQFKNCQRPTVNQQLTAEDQQSPAPHSASELSTPDCLSGEAHKDGEIISSVLWDLQGRMAKETVIKLLLRSLEHTTDSFNELLFNLLLEDDTKDLGGDNDLLNGTPHDEILLTTFYDHGIGPGYKQWSSSISNRTIDLSGKWWKKDKTHEDRLKSLLGGKEPGVGSEEFGGNIDIPKNTAQNNLSKSTNGWVFGEPGAGSSEPASTSDQKLFTENGEKNAQSGLTETSSSQKDLKDQNPEAVASLMEEIANREKIRTKFTENFGDGFTYQLRGDDIRFMPEFLKNDRLEAVQEGDSLVYSGKWADVLYRYDATQRKLKEVIAVEKAPDSLQFTAGGGQPTGQSQVPEINGQAFMETGSGGVIGGEQQQTASGSVFPDFVERPGNTSHTFDLKFQWTITRSKSYLIKDTEGNVFVRDERGNDLLKVEKPFYLDNRGEKHFENIFWAIGAERTDVQNDHVLTLQIVNPRPDDFPLLIDPTVLNDWSFVDQNASSGLNYDATKEAQFPQLVDFQGALYAIWRETNSAGDSHIRAKRFNGNSWVFVDGGGGNGLNFDVIRDAFSPHAVVFGNALYVTWWEQTASVYQIRVKKYDGTTWSFVDGGGATGINQNTARNAQRPSLTVHNGLLYNTWAEENASAVLQIRVKKYDGVSWTTADGGGANGINQDTTKSAERSSLTVYGTMLYNIWIEPNASGVYQIRVKKYDGVSWTTADGGGANGINQDTGRNVTFENPFMVPSGIYLYATWAEQNPSGISQIRVKQYDGTSWISVDGGGVNGLNYDTARNADGTNLQHFNNTLFLGWKETDAGGIDHVHVKRYSSGSWIFVDGGDSTGLNISSITNAREPRMALFGNALYLGFEEESSSLVYQIRVKKYDGNTWYLVDSPISSGTQNTGWLNLTSCSNNTGTGTAAWGTTANALASDNAYSSATLGASVTSNYLVCTTPSGVSIPSGAGITGIEVNVERSSSSGAVGVNILDNAVYLVKNNVILDNLNKAQATVWTTGDTVITYGNSADLWQNTWKVSDFSGAFGLAFSAKNTGIISANGRVDHIQIRIHYTQDFDKGLNKDATKDAYNPEFATYNSDLYATWYEHNASSIGQIRLARYDGIQWTFVDGNGANGLNIDVSKDAQSPHLAVYNGLLYVTWNEADSVSSIQQIRVGAFDGIGWEILDGGGVTGLNFDVNSPAYTPRFQLYNDQIFLLWSEHFTDTIDGPVYHIRAKASDGIDNWYQVEPGSGINQDNFYSGEFPHMAVYNDTLYAIWTESNLTDNIKLVAKQYNNDETWSLTNDIAGLQQSGGYTYPSNPDLASYDGYLYAIWSQTNASLSAQHIRVKRYDGTTWSSFDSSNASVVYIADTSNNRIQRCRPNTTCTVYASAGASLGQVNAPQGIAVYNYDTVYIADTTNNRIQKCTGSTPTCTLYAGVGAALGQVNGPEAIAVDSSGAVYIADRSNNRVQRCTGATPTCTLYAGSGTALGQVNLPEGIAVDQNGVVYIADTGNNRVQRCTAASTCTLYLGSGTSLGTTGTPKGIATDPSGNVYISDANTPTPPNRIQYCTAAATCTLYATSGTSLGTVNQAQGLMADNVGGLYIADSNNNRVQYCTAASTCTQFAGAGTSPGQVSSPRDVDFASSGINYDVTRSGAKPRLVVFGNKLVAAWTEHNGSFFQMRMKYFDGTAWYTADDNTSQNYSTLRGSDSPALVVYKSFVYAGWYESNGTANQIRVKKYDGKSWLSSDGNGTTGLNFNTSNTPVSPQFTEYNNKLYATWVEDSGGSVYQVRVKRYDGNSVWTFVDGGGSTGLNYNTAQSALGANGTASQLAVFNNQLFLIWSEFNTTGSVNQIRVKKYDGTSWTSADSGTVGINQNTSRYAYYPHLAVYGNELYAAWSEAVTAGPAQYNIRVKKTSNGSTWTSVDGGAATGLNKDTTKEAFYPQLIVFGDKLYSIWQEQNGTGVWQSRVRRYDSGSSWTFVDGNGANGINTNTASDAIFPQLVVYQNQMYAAWSEFNASIYQVRVRKYGPTANTWTTVDGGTTTTGLNFDTTKNANAPRMAVFDNRLFITWHESAGSFDLVRLKYFNGSTWYNAENGSTGINYDTTRDAQRPKLTIFGRKLYAIWREHNGTNYQVRVKELGNETYLSFSITSGSSIDFGSLSPNTLYNNYQSQLEVQTNAQNGYQVYVSDSVSGSNSALFAAPNYIPDYPSATTSPTLFNSCASPPCYGLGICVVGATNKNTTQWGTGTTATDTNNKYAGIPQNGTLIHSKAGYSSDTDTTTVSYGLQVSNSQALGSYSGLITYTIVPIP